MRVREPLGEIIDAGYFDIAKRIYEIWGEPECKNYLNKLLFQDRVDRQGFPDKVVIALMELQMLIPDEPNDIWSHR